MVGRRARQKQERERAILRAGARLFERRGYEYTSIKEIAAQAGLAVGTVYNYFPSKPELLLAILWADVAGSREAIAEDLPSDPGAALGTLCDAYLEILLRHERHLWRELLSASFASPDDLGRRLFEIDLGLVAQLTNVLGQFQARGLLRKRFEPSHMAMVLYSIYITAFMAWVTIDTIDEATLSGMIHEGIEMVLCGLLEHPG